MSYSSIVRVSGLTSHELARMLLAQPDGGMRCAGAEVGLVLFCKEGGASIDNHDFEHNLDESEQSLLEFSDRAAGAVAGVAFASDADQELVERIAGWFSEFGAAEIDAAFSKEAESTSADTVAENAYFAWVPENNGSQADANDFWEQHTNSEPSPAFVRGFAEACFGHHANLVR